MIRPGGSGKIVAKVATKGTQSGRFSKSVAVTTDAPGEEYLALSLKYELVPAIVAEPGMNLFLQGVEGQPLVGEVTLRRSDGEPLEISVAVESLATPIEVETARPKAADTSSVVVRVTVAQNGSSIREHGRLTVTTNVPRAPVVVVPLSISVRPFIEVRPQRVHLRIPSRPDEMRSTPVTVRLQSTDRSTFELTSVEISNPELITAELRSSRTHPYHELTVSVADGVSAETVTTAVHAVIRLVCSDPRKPTIEIPVEVMPMPAGQESPFGSPRRSGGRG